jgi:hypothetical protein
MTDGYRSYVVRVRRRGSADDATSLDVEDLLGGRRGAVTGEAARDLATGLETIVGTGTRAVPESGGPGVHSAPPADGPAQDPRG